MPCHDIVDISDIDVHFYKFRKQLHADDVHNLLHKSNKMRITKIQAQALHFIMHRVIAIIVAHRTEHERNQYLLDCSVYL